MPPTLRQLRVFLCHASQDKSIVLELQKRLADEGWIDPWLDEKKLHPGEDWRVSIEEAVEQSDLVVICVSNNSVNKEGFIQKELRYAREISLEKPEGTIFLILLRLDNCDVPRGLRFFQWTDYFGEKKEQNYNDLLESLSIRRQQIIRQEEEKARKKAEEIERKENEERARKAAEEQARREKEELARKQAEEKARKEAEELSRQKALELAKKEAFESALREAKEKARFEAKTQSQRDVKNGTHQILIGVSIFMLVIGIVLGFWLVRAIEMGKASLALEVTSTSYNPTLSAFDFTPTTDNSTALALGSNPTTENSTPSVIETTPARENATPNTTVPEIILKGTEEYTANGKTWIRYRIPITNWQDFPADLFKPSPDLPPCGLNENSSRTWIEIYNGENNSYIYGFCAFSESQDLQLIWFAVEKGSTPPSSVYVVLNDRRENKLYTSNTLTIK